MGNGEPSRAEGPQAHPKPEEGLSVILPAYNEAGNLSGVLTGLLAGLRATASRYEVLVVDDGSEDSTATVVGTVSAGHPQVRLLQHSRNRGYGAAIVTGIRHATYPWLLLMDADGQFVPDDLPAMFQRSADAEVVAGFRIARKDSWVRRVNAWLYGISVRVVLGLRIRDVDCALKLLKASTLRQLELHSQGAVISAEILAKALRAGARIRQVGVRHRRRPCGKATGGAPRVVLRAVRELVRLAHELRRAEVQPACRAAGVPAGRTQAQPRLDTRGVESK